MAAKKDSAETTENRSSAITIDSENGAQSVLASWQGLYHFFGARGNFEIAPDGVTIQDFSVDLDRTQGHGPEQIATDVSHRDRRLPLIPTYFWVQGIPPDPMIDPKDMTQWSVQYYRSSVEEGTSRAPKYVRDAIARFKAEHNLAKKRGPARKTFRVDQLSELNADALKNVGLDELSHLKAIIAQLENTKNSEPSVSTEGELLPA